MEWHRLNFVCRGSNTLCNHFTTEDGQTETIDATPQHPFYVEGKGWVEASALHAGMVVWLADGTKAVITDVVTEGLEEPVAVYNFEVKDFHTYFVGDSGVLVHNKCTNPDGRNGGESHRAVIEEVQNDLDHNGVNSAREAYVPKDPDIRSTAGSRYADIAELNASGEPTIYHQVGRTTQSGLPVARESRAIEDIVTRTQLPVVFHSYNDPGLQPLVYLP